VETRRLRRCISQGTAPIRVLIDLHYALQAFSGISQETRLMFGEMASIEGMEIGGIVNTQPDLRAAIAGKGFLGRRNRNEGRALIDEIDRIIAHRKLKKTFLQKTASRFRKMDLSRFLSVSQDRQKGDSLVTFASQGFEDLIWDKLFAPTLPEIYKGSVVQQHFFAVRTGRRSANRIALSQPAVAARINTSSWDVLIAHTPFPYAISAGTKLVVRYYDAIPVLFPDTVSEGADEAERHRALLQKNVRSGAWFSCISEPVRHDLVRLAPEAEGRAFVTPCMVSPIFWPDNQTSADIQGIVSRRACPSSVLRKGAPDVEDHQEKPHQEISPNFFLAVSTLEPRKNFHFLINAWAELRSHLDEMPDLVLIANPGWRFAEAAAAIDRWRGRGLFHLWKVPMDELRMLYSAARAVVCPSIAEGFNLAGVEAMRCNTAVIASDIPVHRWVYGDAALYFNPARAASLVRLLAEAARWRGDEGDVIKLRDRGLKQSAQYRPDTVARTWREVLRRVASE
jgi:glycosyltransferase involved in cell wall biosynthesis